MTPASGTPGWHLVALAPAVAYLLGALIRPRQAPRISLGAGLLALMASLFHGLTGRGLSGPDDLVPVGLDLLACLMLILVTGLGALIVHFSQTYLKGEPGFERALEWLLGTLAAVSCLVVARSLWLVGLAWAATSLALHQLLTFYRDRTPALVAAHKKFLVSRLADLFFIAATVLVFVEVGSTHFDDLFALVKTHPTLPVSLQLAAVLLVGAVALKSAQLPFHGWLIQVMEAPTPVSALLHAGVVNIGGFVLIRLSPWLAQARVAQALLVVIGTFSATVAALVMTTRVSVKVGLAWSTCAQMGFMLVQCGLGLWPLALLHLFAHSLYKAHAFLSAGTTVQTWQWATLASARTPVSTGRSIVSGLVGFTLVTLTLMGWHFTAQGTAMSATPELAFTALVLGLGLAPILSGQSVSIGWKFSRIALVLVLSTVWHALASRLLGTSGSSTDLLAWSIAGLGFFALFAVKTALHQAPTGRLAQTLHPWLFSGLYLDELFTRLTFRLWPPHLAPKAPATEWRTTTASLANGARV